MTVKDECPKSYHGHYWVTWGSGFGFTNWRDVRPMKCYWCQAIDWS